MSPTPNDPAPNEPAPNEPAPNEPAPNEPAPNEPTFEITLTAMAHGGSALGRHDGRTVFVPYTIPGEVVAARITAEKGRVAFAEGVRLVDASTDRVFPQCPHFGPGRCGRCQWQHIDHGAQRLLKQDVLADQLSRVGRLDDATIDAAMQPITGTDAAWGYLYRMTLTATADGQLGFPQVLPPGTTPLTDADPPLAIIDDCPIMHPDLLDLLHRLDLDFSDVKRVTLQRGTDGAQMIVMHVDNEDDAPELEVDFPASANLLLPDNEPVNLIGDSHSRYEIDGRGFRVTAGSEFRGSVEALPLLARLVTQALALTGEEAVLDLYAGVGLFSAFIAPHASLVTLVESYPPAVTDADDNLADFDHVDVIEGTVEDVLASLLADDDDAAQVSDAPESYDAAVLDPPAAGLSLEAMDALAALALPRLVYVSSDPATLARDAARLIAHGYRLDRVQPLDLHPQTYFIDAVATFLRA